MYEIKREKASWSNKSKSTILEQVQIRHHGFGILSVNQRLRHHVAAELVVPGIGSPVGFDLAPESRYSVQSEFDLSHCDRVALPMAVIAVEKNMG